MNLFTFILDYADQHSAAIQAISTIVLVGIAALALLWNERMANVMQKTYELSARPYAGIDANVGKSEGPDWIELDYKIVNLGSVPVVIRVEAATFRGEATVSKKENGVVLYPKQSAHSYARYAVPPGKAADLRGEAEIRITYSALGIPEKKYFHRRVIGLEPFSNIAIVRDEAGEI